MPLFRAYAKINLGLRILEKRPDGYHNIETVFHRIDLFDEIELSSSSTIKVVSTSDEVPGDESNICHNAARLLRNYLGISAFQFGILTAVEMITSMLIYIPVAYYADRHFKKPFILITFIFFTIFPIIIYFSESFTALVFAFVVRGLKEFGEPTRKSLIMDLAPDGAKAETFGTYYLFRDVIVSGAALSSAFLWNISPFTNFMTASVCGVIGTVWFAVWAKDIKQSVKN